MLEKIKKIFFQSSQMIFLATAWAANPITKRLEDVGTGSAGIGYKKIRSDNPSVYFTEKIASLVKIFLSFLAVIFIVLIIYGGFMWMTAAGSENKVSKAKKIISDATIGLGVVVLAYAITWFVLYYLGQISGFQTGL